MALHRIKGLVRLLALLPVVVVGCSSEASLEAPPQLPPEKHLLEVAFDARVTTHADIAVNNFLARVEALRERMVRFPDDQALRAMLVEHLLARATFLGTFEDFDEVDALTEDQPGADGALMRASFLSAVHRFDEARTKLDQAEQLGAPSLAIERARIVIELAIGEDPNALLPRAQSLVDASERYGHLTVLASVLGALGRYEEADATYLRALGAYRDSSPFTLAWVSFVRGVMWGEAAGRRDLAEALYEDAIARLPHYVVANVHLSEIEDTEVAVARLRRVLDSQDPEPAARLAQRLTGPERDELLARARARYEELLTRHRAAFLDHASEYYAIAGEPERALDLALENLDMRRNGRAYVVAIQAALAAGSQGKLCQLLEASAPERPRHRVLDELVAANENRCR